MDLQKFCKDNCLNITTLAKRSGLCAPTVFKLIKNGHVRPHNILAFFHTLKSIEKSISDITLESLLEREPSAIDKKKKKKADNKNEDKQSND